MAKDNRNGSSGEAVRADTETSLETIIRSRARGLIEAVVEEELGAARQGYRHRNPAIPSLEHGDCLLYRSRPIMLSVFGTVCGPAPRIGAHAASKATKDVVRAA